MMNIDTPTFGPLWTRRFTLNYDPKYHYSMEYNDIVQTTEFASAIKRMYGQVSYFPCIEDSISYMYKTTLDMIKLVDTKINYSKSLISKWENEMEVLIQNPECSKPGTKSYYEKNNLWRAIDSEKSYLNVIGNLQMEVNACLDDINLAIKEFNVNI